MKQFHAYRIALELIKVLRTILPRLRKVDRNLERHAREAATSFALNIAEGNRRQGRDRIHHFNVAAGSTDEVNTGLEIALAWGYLPEEDLTPALELCDRLLAVLYRLTHPR